MKKICKYFTVAFLGVIVCLFLAVPAMAQRGGHGGGGSMGGGHMGGGFSGGGHMGGGFSGGRSVGVAPQHFNSAPRSGFAPQRGAIAIQRGAVAPRGGFSRGQRTIGFRGTSAVMANGSRVAVRGYHGAGLYGHGGTMGRYGWRRHDGYFYNRGFYGSLYYPMLGLGFGYLPDGCYPFYWDDDMYYFGNGFYYQYDNDQYTVVEPPMGAEIKSLPSDAQSIVINGQQYYELNGVYYLPVTKDDGTVTYEIAGKDGELNTDSNGAVSVLPKVGDIVKKLPPDCKKVNLNGAAFFVSEDGIYYQEIKDNNNKKAYKIVGLDADGPEN